jgi:flagellar M-ring protein FliF
MADESKSIVEQAKALWQKLSTRQKAAAVGAVVATLVGTLALSLRTEMPKEAVLYSGLPADEAGSIVRELDAAKVPYRLDHGGSTIWVPEARLPELRLHMATSGLPRGGGYGYEELLNSKDFGRTKFMEEVSSQRALSGELTRSITTIDDVERARVILALPNQKLFTKSQEPPSASVVLTLRHGRELNKRQVKGIVNLVSSAVERMRPENVSVVDDSGNVLWGGDDEHAEPDALQRELERTLARRVSDITDRLVGRERAVVTVTSEFDHSVTERTEELYDKERAAIRSQTRSEEIVQVKDNSTGGVVGTRSNLPGTVQPPADGAATATGTERKKVTETQNNEVSRVVAVTHGPKAQLKRIHVAVLVHGLTEADAALLAPPPPVVATSSTSSLAVAVAPPPPARSKMRVWTKAELDRLALLAREAAGLDLARGDRIEVHCAPFHDQDEELVSEPPPPPALWQKVLEKYPWWYFAAAAGALALLMVLAVVVVLVRRRRRAVIEPIAMPTLPLRAAEVDQVLAGELPTPAEPHGPGHEAEPDPRVLAVEAAKADPARAAQILSAWLAEGAPAGALPAGMPAAHAAPAAAHAEGAAR